MKISSKLIFFFILLQFFIPRNFLVAMELDGGHDSDLIEYLITDWERKLKISDGGFKSDEDLFSQKIKDKLKEILAGFLDKKIYTLKDLKKFFLKGVFLKKEVLQSWGLEVRDGMLVPAYYFVFEEVDGIKCKSSGFGQKFKKILKKVKRGIGKSERTSVYFFRIIQEGQEPTAHLDLPFFVWSYYFCICFSSGKKELVHFVDKKLCLFDDVRKFTSKVQEHVSLGYYEDCQRDTKETKHEKQILIHDLKKKDKTIFMLTFIVVFMYFINLLYYFP